MGEWVGNVGSERTRARKETCDASVGRKSSGGVTKYSDPEEKGEVGDVAVEDAGMREGRETEVKAEDALDLTGTSGIGAGMPLLFPRVTRRADPVSMRSPY